MKRYGWIFGLVSSLLCAALMFTGCTLSEKQTTNKIDEEGLTKTERFYVNTARDMYIANIEISDPPKGQEMSTFFRWMIAQELYNENHKAWYDGTVYRIPLEDIQTVLYRHLDVDSFSPEEIFPAWDENSSVGYDSHNQEYIIKMMGGYGGAQSMCLLGYNEKQDAVEVVVGVYDMNKLFSDEPSEEIVKTYTVCFDLSSKEKPDFKIVSAKAEVQQRLRNLCLCKD